MARWSNFRLVPIPGADFLNDFQESADALLGVAEAVLNVLDVVQTFMFDFPNPVKFAVDALLAQVQQLLDDLRKSGVYGLYILPTTLEEVALYRGGYGKFRELFVTSVYDVRDANRPQIGSQGYMGAVFLLFTKDSAASFIGQTLDLADLFRLPTDVAYPGAINLKITPATNAGAVPGDLASLLSATTSWDALLMEWEEPKFGRDVFLDVFSDNKFYLERSRTRDGYALVKDYGRLALKDPLADLKAANGVDAAPYDDLVNRLGEPAFYWEPVNPDKPFIEMGDPDLDRGYIAGSYTYLLKGVAKGKDNAYYYRVRSVPKDTVLIPQTSSYVDDVGDVAESITTYNLSGKGPLARPSSPALGFLPDPPAQVDLPTAVLNLYRAAYLLRFDAEFYEDNRALPGSLTLTPSIPAYLERLDAGADGIGGFATLGDEAQGEKPVRYFTGPLFEKDVPEYAQSQRYVATVGTLVGSTVLEADPFAGAREMFEQAIFNLSPAERLRLFVDREALGRVERVLPVLAQNEALARMVQDLYLRVSDRIALALTQSDPGADVFRNANYRQDILSALQALEGHSRPGAPPNWRSLRIFADIFPGGDALVDQLATLLTGLSNAYGGASVSLGLASGDLRQRLALLNSVIDFLDEVVAFYANLDAVNFTASALVVPPDRGGVDYLVRAIMESENPPDTEADSYVAGVVLAYGGATVEEAAALATTAKIVFGT